jgi:hypothetical protein
MSRRGDGDCAPKTAYITDRLICSAILVELLSKTGSKGGVHVDVGGLRCA